MAVVKHFLAHEEEEFVRSKTIPFLLAPRLIYIYIFPSGAALCVCWHNLSLESETLITEIVATSKKELITCMMSRRDPFYSARGPKGKSKSMECISFLSLEERLCVVVTSILPPQLGSFLECCAPKWTKANRGLLKERVSANLRAELKT